MGCDCVYVGDPGESSEEIKNETRTAKKVHVCYECRGKILPSEKYLYEVIKTDGKLSTYKTCFDCKSVRDTFFCGGWWYGQVWDDLREHISCGPVSEDCIADLTPTARDRVCDIIEKAWNK